MVGELRIFLEVKKFKNAKRSCLLVGSPRMLSRFLLLFCYRTPVKFQLPVECSNKVLLINQMESSDQSRSHLRYKFVLHRLLIYGLNDRTGNSPIISCNAIKQRLEPSIGCLNVRVKEGEHVRLSGFDPRHPSPHQSLPESKSKKAEFWDLRHQDIEVFFEVIHGGGIVNEEDFMHKVGWRPVQH